MTIKSYINKCPNYFPKRYSKTYNRYFVPDMFVLHNTGGSKISSAHWWFLDETSYTSAHYLVGLDGEVRQYVDLESGSYCNGTSDNPKKAGYYKNATNEIVREREYNANLYTVSIEFVGGCGKKLTEQQMNAAVELIKHINYQLKKKYGSTIPYDRKHMIGHYEINPINKETCGVNIQFDELLKRLKADQIEESELSGKTEEFEQKKEPLTPSRKRRYQGEKPKNKNLFHFLKR